MSGRTDIFERAMNQGNSAAWDQSWDVAATSYRQALNEFPEDPKALSSLGLCLYKLDQYEQALNYYGRAATVSPDDPMPIEKIAELGELLGKMGQATTARLKAAEMYLNNRELEKSVDNFSMVTRLDPKNLRAHSRLAVIFERTGRKPQAVREYLVLASLIQPSGDREKALQAARYALKIAPENTDAQQAVKLLEEEKSLPEFNLGIDNGQLHKTAEKPFKDLDKLEQVVSELDPVADARRRAIGMLAGLVFDLSEEIRDPGSDQIPQSIFSGSIGNILSKQSDSNLIRTHLSQAIDMYTRGELGQASFEIAKVIEAGLDHAAAYFNVGFYNAQNNDLENAISNLHRALMHPDLTLGSRLLLGQTLRRLGRMEESAIEYLEALKLADSKVVPEEDAYSLIQLYESLIESESQHTDLEAKYRLCDNIEELLMRGNWFTHLMQVRQELLVGIDGGSVRAIAEILLEARSSRIVESVNRMRQLIQNGHLQSAMEEAFYALDYAPTYLPLHLDMGELLLKLDHRQAAIDKFNTIAHTYNMRGEISRAIDLYRRVIKLSPIDLTARNSLIKLLVDHGQLKEAIAEYLRLAEVYYNMADLNKARQTYSDAFTLAQSRVLDVEIRAQILRRMADIDLQSLDWRQALQIFEQIRRLKPGDLEVRTHLVDLNYRLTKVEQATTELDDFLSYLIKQGDKDQAIKFLKKLQVEHPDKAILQQRLDKLLS